MKKYSAAYLFVFLYLISVLSGFGALQTNFVGAHFGNGSGLTNLQATNIANLQAGPNIAFSTNAGIISISSTNTIGTVILTNNGINLTNINFYTNYVTPTNVFDNGSGPLGVVASALPILPTNQLYYVKFNSTNSNGEYVGSVNGGVPSAINMITGGGNPYVSGIFSVNGITQPVYIFNTDNPPTAGTPVTTQVYAVQTNIGYYLDTNSAISSITLINAGVQLLTNPLNEFAGTNSLNGHWLASSNTQNGSTLNLQATGTAGYADINFITGGVYNNQSTGVLRGALGVGVSGTNQFPYNNPYWELFNYNSFNFVQKSYGVAARINGTNGNFELFNGSSSDGDYSKLYFQGVASNRSISVIGNAYIATNLTVSNSISIIPTNGSTQTPFQIITGYPEYVQSWLQNTNNSPLASSVYSIGNDLSSPSSLSNYVEFGINSSTFTNVANGGLQGDGFVGLSPGVGTNFIIISQPTNGRVQIMVGGNNINSNKVAEFSPTNATFLTSLSTASNIAFITWTNNYYFSSPINNNNTNLADFNLYQVNSNGTIAIWRFLADSQKTFFNDTNGHMIVGFFPGIVQTGDGLGGTTLNIFSNGIVADKHSVSIIDMTNRNLVGSNGVAALNWTTNYSVFVNGSLTASNLSGNGQPTALTNGTGISNLVSTSTKPLQAAAGQYEAEPRNGAPQYWFTNEIAGRSSATVEITRVPYWTTRTPIQDISIQYATSFIDYTNQSPNIGGSETGISTNIANVTIGSVVEYPAGVFHTMTFNGATTAVCPTNQSIASDRVPLFIPPNTAFWVRTFAQSTNGAPLGYMISYQGGANTTGMDAFPDGRTLVGAQCVVGTNLAYSAITNTMTNISAHMFAPSAVLSSSVRHAIGFIGDSITRIGVFGTNISNGTATNTSGGLFIGYLSAGIGTNYPTVEMNFYGNSLKYEFTNGLPHTNVFPTSVDTLIVELGANDIVAGTPTNYYQTLTNQYQQFWNYCYSNNIRVFQTTLIPHSYASNSINGTFNSYTNQYYDTGIQYVRTNFNNWVRTVPWPLSGVFDMAALVESTNNSGYWNVNTNFGTTNATWTYDGLHPTTYAAGLMANVISNWVQSELNADTTILPLQTASFNTNVAGALSTNYTINFAGQQYNSIATYSNVFFTGASNAPGTVTYLITALTNGLSLFLPADFTVNNYNLPIVATNYGNNWIQYSLPQNTGVTPNVVTMTTYATRNTNNSVIVNLSIGTASSSPVSYMNNYVTTNSIYGHVNANSLIGNSFSPSTNFTVTALGRYIYPTNSNVHIMQLWYISAQSASSDTCTLLATVPLNAASYPSNTWGWASLTNPVVLTNNGAYIVTSSEIYNQDYTPVTTTTGNFTVADTFQASSSLFNSALWSGNPAYLSSPGWIVNSTVQDSITDTNAIVGSTNNTLYPSQVNSIAEVLADIEGYVSANTNSIPTTNNINGNLNVVGSATVAGALTVTGTNTLNGVVTGAGSISNNLITNALIYDGVLAPNATVPTITATNATQFTGLPTVVGNDRRMIISFTMSGSPTATTNMMTVAYATPRPQADFLGFIVPVNNTAVALSPILTRLYVTNLTTTNFQIWCGSAPTANGVYQIGVVMVQ